MQVLAALGAVEAAACLADGASATWEVFVPQWTHHVTHRATHRATHHVTHRATDSGNTGDPLGTPSKSSHPALGGATKRRPWGPTQLPQVTPPSCLMGSHHIQPSNKSADYPAYLNRGANEGAFVLRGKVTPSSPSAGPNPRTPQHPPPSASTGPHPRIPEGITLT